MAQKRTPKGAPDPLELDVDIADFGPISRGRFKIKPLTILIGPNNSGKTYAAMLVHTVFTSHMATAAYWFMPRHVKSQILKPEFRSMAREVDRLLGKKPNGNGYAVIPSGLVNKIYKMIFQNVETHFSQALANNFGLKPHSLVRIGASSSKLSIRSNNNFSATISKKTNAIHSHQQCEYLIKRKTDRFLIRPSHMEDPKFDKFVSLINTRSYGAIGQISKDLPRGAEDGTIALLTLMLHILYMSGEHIPFRSYYFPAARSGIMQAYRAVVSGSKQPRVPSSDQTTPSEVSGVLSSFVASVLNTEPKNSAAFRPVGESVESQLFEGEMLVSNPAIGTPEIFYRFMKRDIPAHIFSSSIAEISPLSMFLRSDLQKGDMLIIEEPDAHLHPANQLILAKHLVSLIRRGVRILLTTHSVFFLEQLSIFVKLGSLTSEQRKRHGRGADDFLLDDEVAPFVFKKISKGNHTIKEIPHSATEGISQEEFVSIDIDMYNMDLNIDDMIQSNKGEN
ncbi:MAG: AAA family ATPase [Thaumarchaeota archaeon]|nr:AAA family ATPase [Nitrososphaerota archaeon]